jgi:hypothetical protein
MMEVETVDASSTIRLLEASEELYPMLALIHVFLDNARYCRARPGVAGWAGSAHSVAFHSALLPSPESDRTALGAYAQACDTQHVLRQLPRIRRSNLQVSARHGSQKLGKAVWFGHRQFPRHLTQRFPGYDVNRDNYHTKAAKANGATGAQIEAVASAALVRKWNTMLNGTSYNGQKFQQQVDSIFATH